ncbi:hypothetical protein L596_016101 [Steinernema carpocapsae]|uniref:Uncharacterized protein n=1 Tax=Steinernema carpocapsae TaxID=34508 RepID=A0A4U5NHL3_STECR|nr:hypothetical protein L596_016101 [Steinernema carpocapsae]
MRCQRPVLCDYSTLSTDQRSMSQARLVAFNPTLHQCAAKLKSTFTTCVIKLKRFQGVFQLSNGSITKSKPRFYTDSSQAAFIGIFLSLEIDLPQQQLLHYPLRDNPCPDAPRAINSVAIVLLFILSNFTISNSAIKWQVIQMRQKDERVEMANEVVNVYKNINALWTWKTHDSQLTFTHSPHNRSPPLKSEVSVKLF